MQSFKSTYCACILKGEKEENQLKRYLDYERIQGTNIRCFLHKISLLEVHALQCAYLFVDIEQVWSCRKDGVE